MRSNATEELQCNNNVFSYITSSDLLLFPLLIHLLIMKILAVNFRFENPCQVHRVYKVYSVVSRIAAVIEGLLFRSNA